jgi:hypothetical protein
LLREIPAGPAARPARWFAINNHRYFFPEEGGIGAPPTAYNTQKIYAP